LRVILCVGESAEIRAAGEPAPHVCAQVQQALPPSTTAENTRIAYEPIWSIGTGVVPTLEAITAMHAALHDAVGLPVLYGGSVTAGNAEAILALPCVSGVLVGGASLYAHSLEGILQASERAHEARSIALAAGVTG
jgi:triosephosphate isomerase